MIDINVAYSEASRNLLSWRNRYTTKEYPHKIVLNMMYRAYGMNYIWNEFTDGKLPIFKDTNEALLSMENHYAKISMEKIHSSLLYWLESYPKETIGTLTYANYDSLATLAETDSTKCEELEFSYIFNLLEDKCVLYFIAFRQMGKSFIEAVGIMTDLLIEDIPNMTYGIAKQVFQQLLVGKYMQEHYVKLP